MEKMKSKFIQAISDSFDSLNSITKEINDGYSKINPEEKLDRLNLGGKMLQLQQINIELMKSVDLFINTLDGKMEELPEPVQKYFQDIEEMKKPVSETDSKEVKAIKEYIKNYNKENG